MKEVPAIMRSHIFVRNAAAAALAGLLCTTVTGCAAVAPPSAPANRVAIRSPMMTACAEFYRLRDAELGPHAPVTTQPLDIANVRELFRRAEAFGFSGGLQLLEKGQADIDQGYGMADRARGIPISTDTIFDIGSVSKQFTAAGILRLEEMGRLRTSDPIAKHLPAVPADKQAITIHHLLTHSAGFPHDVGDNLTNPGRDTAVAQMLAAELKFSPGSSHAYTNVGYALLAAIVERTSGKSYETFLRDELWLPLGMARTGMVLGGLDKAPIAEGYMFDGALQPNLYRTADRDGASWLVRGAGYIFSTLDNMGRWGEALRTGRILSDASRRKLFWPHVREADKIPSYYGYGWALFSNRDGSCRIGHDGSAGVHYAFQSFFPERDVVLTAYSTQQRSPWRYFPNKVYSALTGAALDVPPVAAQVPPGLEQILGDYHLPNGAVLPVRAQEGRLYIEVLNADSLRLFSPWPMLNAQRVQPLGDRQKFVSHVMDAVAKGDYRPLLAKLRKGVDQEEERHWWEARWPRWSRDWGAYIRTELAGTVELDGTGPIQVEPEDRLRSLAIVRFERGSMVMGFVHDAEGTIYVDWMPQHMMRDVFLAPSVDGDFLTFSPNTKRSARVRFEKSGGETRSLVIDNGQETARAIRRKGS